MSVHDYFKHLKSGGHYVVVRRNVQVQASTRPIVEGDLLVIYESFDSRPWARLADEFNDGRFVPITAENVGLSAGRLQQDLLVKVGNMIETALDLGMSAQMAVQALEVLLQMSRVYAAAQTGAEPHQPFDPAQPATGAEAFIAIQPGRTA